MTAETFLSTPHTVVRIIEADGVNVFYREAGRDGEALAPAPIDINHASLEQLKGLPGISEAQAKLIIEKRPYHSKAQLVTANVLPAGVFQSIRHMIIAIQPGPTRPSKHP